MIESDSPGQAIRVMRRDKSMTLAQLSAKTGLAVSTLSKLEKGQISLSFEKLALVSKGLGVDMASLLDPQPSSARGPTLTSGRRVIQRAGDGQLLETRSYKQTYLATELLNKKITPMIVEVKARSVGEFKDEFGGLIHHAGEEFALVLEGEVTFYTELYAPVNLKRGDSVYFDSEMGHAYLKVSDGPCSVVCACSSSDADTEIPEMFVSASERGGQRTDASGRNINDRRPRVTVKRGN